MHVTSFRIAPALALLALTAGCKPEPLPGERTGALRPTEQHQRGTPEEGEQGGRITDLTVATIAGRPLTVGAVERRMDMISPEGRRAIDSVQQRADAVQMLVMAQALAIDAERKGYLGSAEEALMEELHLAHAWLLEMAAERSATDPITNEEIEAEWQALQPWIDYGQMRLGQYMMATTREQLDEMLATYERVRLRGRDEPVNQFKDVAARYTTEDRFRVNGFLLDWMIESDVQRGANPELVNALFALEAPGDVSPPFATAEGWMSVQLLQIRDSDEDANATTARPWLLERLANQQAGDAQATALEDLRAQATIEINEQAMAMFVPGGDPERPRRYDPEALRNDAMRLLNQESLTIMRTGPTPAPTRMALVGRAPQPEAEGSAPSGTPQEIAP